MGRIDRQMEYENQTQAKILHSAGTVEALAGFLYGGGKIQNFMISGSAPGTNTFLPVKELLSVLRGKIPVVIFTGRPGAPQVTAGYHSGIWYISSENREFEPFSGMSEIQIISALRHLAQRLHYTVTPGLERVVQAHLRILELLGIPSSLSGFFYLCQFNDMEELHQNINSLPCSEAEASRLWADLGIGETTDSQFDLFRAVIRNLSLEAWENGWSDENIIAEYNCLHAIREGTVLIFSINSFHTELLWEYLTEELRASCGIPFILLLDNIKLQGSSITDYLLSGPSGCQFGIISENAPEFLNGSDQLFQRLCESVRRFIFFKHGTGKTAVLLSETIGKFDYKKVELSTGRERRSFQLLFHSYHEGVRYSSENRYRVMPETFMGLGEKQAVLFNAETDQVIFYNV